MSKEISASRLMTPNVTKDPKCPSNENQFESSVNVVHFPPPRTPLNAIADPAQYLEECKVSDIDSLQKIDAARFGRNPKCEGSENNGNGCVSSGTHRVSGRVSKAHSEPNSGQSTPVRGYSRYSLGAGVVVCTGSRAPQLTGSTSSRVSRGISISRSEPSNGVPHFELVEHPSFWTDHNVQVLIRIRPLSNVEKVSQGYDRCLRQESAQTMAWLGHPEARFTFDHIACETISQESLFKVAGLPMVDNCMSGYNSCMFAYGQTGSGKTYTMMGELFELEGELNIDRGLTPRIFEYLFSRIREEEESRTDEKLKYSCKCSFLEIYNEQITDLLEPSSNNLLLREDLKKGVYVENLSEYSVMTVNDVVTLLLKGAANRKVSATYMNRESSRSHCVFTCTIESHWEKDSISHLRFSRLNLVDLAGSERQKTSGSEGDRLKEAANINKSLSTLGLVIMSLVDLAHGKHRHVPYRDSRLTFLLQDSLGGNSKTTIIANVSPSICSANETMSTLKFAQRAKMIQNNAIVNEDALVDITAPQWQIQESKMKCLEDALVGALRREKVAEIAIRKLEIEIERTNNLAFQHEEEVRSTNMILKLREEKIKQLELLLDGSLAAEKYLVQENEALLKEIQLLQERNHRNPKLARLTFENAKLLEELQLFQSFYEQGERQALLDEVAKLRNQVLMMEHNEDITKISLQSKIEQVTRELEVARLCYAQYHEDQASQLSQEKEVDLVREQVEVETARTIIQLQEEVGDLQLELHQRLCSMSQENSRLRTALCTKEKETMAQCIEWETATLELTNFIADSSRSIKDAYGHIENITHSFPKVNVCLDEHIQRAASALLEKEETILMLQNSFENAQNMVREMESKLSSLKVAATAFNEIKEVNIECTEDGNQLNMLVNDKSSKINILERELKYKEEQCAEAEKRADAAFLVAKWLSDSHKVDSYVNFINRQPQTSKLDDLPEMTRVNDKVKELEKVEAESNLIKLGVLELKNVMYSYYKETEKYASAVTCYFNDMSSECKEIFQNLVTEAHDTRMQIKALKENRMCAEELIVKDNINKVENQSDTLNQIRFELSRLNNRLTIFRSCMYLNYAVESQVKTQESVEVDTWSSACSSPSSDSSTRCAAYNARKNFFLDAGCNNSMEGFVSHCRDVQGKPCFDSLNKKEVSCLRKEVEMMFNSFSKLYLQVAALTNGLDTLNDNSSEDLKLGTSSLAGRVENVEACAIDTKEVAPNDKIKDEVELLQKFEEAKMTIKEADAMLNTLVQAHENEKQLNCMWKQAGEKLLVERATLFKEVEQLKSMIDLKEGDNKSMQEQFLFTLKEIENAVSLYEDCFSELQREVEDKFSATYSDIVSMGNEMLKVLKNCNPSMEYIYRDFKRKEFAAFHRGERVHNIHSFNIVEPEQQKCGTMNKGFQSFFTNAKDDEMVNGIKNEYDQGLSCANGKRTEENVALKKELLRKEVLLEGLLFDISLLQESTSETKDTKDETERINFLFSQVQHELEIKTSQLDDMQVQQRKLEGRLVDTEKALFLANSNLELANETVCTYSHQNMQLKTLLNGLYVTNSEIERQLEEKKELVNGLENEILHLTSSVDERILVSIESIENDLRRVISERDELSNEVCFLTDKLKLTYAFVDEKEAAAIVAHQDAEASKVYAEQKEEEVRVLEHSVEELENTINMLERKVYEMDNEVQQHHSIRDELEMELEDLRQRLMTVESFSKTMDWKNTNGEQAQEEISRKLRTKAMQLFEAKNQIKILEEERAEQDDEIKNYRDYISELVLHSDAQATQYQQKYSNLEAMMSEVSNRLSNPSSEITVDKSEKNPARRRGSSSPFRCIASVMHQMNLEKDNELAVARLCIEELEALAVSRQKEVCILNTRIAAAESMTHDVIRDLLGVKLDMTKYADLIEHYQVQKRVEEAHLHSQEFQAKELEVFTLKAKINELTEERESCKHVISKKEAEVISAQMNLERVRERDQLLCAQNEMLKMDNANLKRKTAELDEMVTSLLGKQSTPHNVHQILKIKETDMLGIDDNELTIRLANSKKLLSRVNNEISHYLGPTIIPDRK